MAGKTEDPHFAGAELAKLRDGRSSSVDAPLQARTIASWDGEYDLIVVGFGLAGASAALEAAERGQRVLLLDRFQGGGSSQMSGGVVYAGGGTHVQRDCEVEDSVDGMTDYLKLEVGGLVQLRSHHRRPALDLRRTVRAVALHVGGRGLDAVGTHTLLHVRQLNDAFHFAFEP